MCLIAFALEPGSRYRLLLAGNRDEFHNRPAAAAHWWDGERRIYGGRDLVGGGTWLGINRSGRIAALTNFRDRPHRGPGERSRGELGAGYLVTPGSGETYAASIVRHMGSFGGFNLLLFEAGRDRANALYFSNRQAETAPLQIAEGVHGLSNHLLNTPWPKVERLRTTMRSALELTDPIEALLDALADRSPARSWGRGAALDDGALEGTPFIADPRYGTRASTVIAIGHSGEVTFCERSWDWLDDRPRFTGERRLFFRIQS